MKRLPPDAAPVTDEHGAPSLGEALRDQEETMPRLGRWMYSTFRERLGSRVLDAGAGLGTFTEFLLEDGREVVSLEAYKPFADHLAGRFGGDPRVEVLHADFAAAGGLPEFAPVDSAICLNVLEHIEDDVAALRNIRERVKPGGALIALVPSYPRLFNTLDRAVGHHRRYNRRQFRRALKAGGWTVEDCRSFNVFGLPGWFLAGSVLKRSTPGRGLSRIYDSLIPVFSAFERTLVRGAFGLSLVATCRRADSPPGA